MDDIILQESTIMDREEIQDPSLANETKQSEIAADVLTPSNA